MANPVVFLSSFEDATPGSATTWTDYDSANVPDGAIGVILRVRNIGTTSRQFSARKNGSTDDRPEDILRSSVADQGMFFYIGVDGSGIFEVYVENTSDLFVELIGYFTADAGSFFTNLTEKTPGSASTWTDINISSDTGSDTAVAAFLEISNSSTRSIDVRENGSSDATYDDTLQKCGVIVGCDNNEIFELYVENTTNNNVYLAGYLVDGIVWRINASSVTTATSWTDHTFNASAIAGIFKICFGTYNVGVRLNGSSENVQYRPDDYMWAIVECDGSGIAEHISSLGSATVLDAGYFVELSGGVNPVSASATIAGAATFAGGAGVTWSGKATIAAAGVFSGQGTRVIQILSSIDGAGVMVPQPTRKIQGVNTIQAQASLQMVPRLRRSATSSINATSTVTSSGLRKRLVSTVIAAVSIINAASKLRIAASTTISAVSSIIGTVRVKYGASAVIAAVSTISATAIVNKLLGAVLPYISIFRRRRRG